MTEAEIRRHFEAAVAHHRADRLDQAEALYRDILRARPGHADALHLLGAIAHQRGRHDSAIGLIRAALALQPRRAHYHYNLGLSLDAAGCRDEAETCFREAIGLDPDFAEAHANLSLSLLLKGDYGTGWRKYEWWWRTKQPGLRQFQEPMWSGEPIGQRTVLLHAAQGFGDMIQFCRYAPLAAARARIVLEAPPQLVRLLSGLPGVSRIAVQGEPLPYYDLHCPLLRLPRLFGTTVATIPAQVPYLKADPAQAAAWRERLAGLPGLRIGLVWAGGPRPSMPAAQAIDRRRSITLAQLAPLAGIAGTSLVSLQKGDAARQAGSSPPGLVLHDWAGELADFADTAALVEALDLVISVDTAVVHLAGALGKPVWILNRYDTCWRWLSEREDSPWYPTARLFRQPRPGDWDSVVERVAAELARAASRPQPAASAGSVQSSSCCSAKIEV